MEDIYENIECLRDYFNTWVIVHDGLTLGAGRELGITPQRLEECLKKTPIRTVEQRFLDKKSDQFEKPGSEVRQKIKEHPEKVKRLSKIAQLVNSSPRDVLLFKRSMNEVSRLLYGKKEDLMFTEGESHPDLLVIPTCN